MSKIIHGFKISKKKYLVPIFLATTILPIIVILIIGKISEVSLVGLFSHLGISLFRLLSAYCISLVLAITIAVIIGPSRLSDFFIPIFDLLQNLPSFALIPLFVVLFGYTDKMAIIFTASSVLWPLLFYIIHTIKTAPNDLNRAAALFGATGWKRIFYYYIPLSFSSIITGSMIAFSIGWEAVIGIEILGLKSGIGYFLNTALAENKLIFSLGLACLLVLVFIINRLIWTPLLKKAEIYGE